MPTVIRKAVPNPTLLPVTSPRRLVAWFVVGVTVASFLIVTQAMATGGLAGVLQVGEDAPVRPLIEAQLGPIPLANDIGHDGQLSYAIGLDLGGGTVAPFIDHAGYRYRRILLPAVGSLFGLLDGRGLLFGLSATVAVGFGLATVATAELSRVLHSGRWAVAGILANPGAWLGARLLTPDPLGLGLGLTAVALAMHRRHVLAACLAGLAALAKDQFLLFGLGLAAAALWHRDLRRAGLYLAASMTPLALWSFFVTATVGDGLSPRSNLSFPLQGMVEASARWLTSGQDLVYLVIVLAFMVLAAVALWRFRDPTWLALGVPWLVLAIVSSSWVWDFGNNALRVFAVFGVVAALCWRAKTNVNPWADRSDRRPPPGDDRFPFRN